MINTRQDWWDAVDKHWSNLTDIIFHHMDYHHPAFTVPGNPQSEMTGNNIGQEVESLKENRDSRLARYFNAAWGLASEAYCWSVPSWGVLCDLCSEEYVLYDEDCDGNNNE